MTPEPFDGLVRLGLESASDVYVLGLVVMLASATLGIFVGIVL